jgi:hypothetical protein
LLGLRHETHINLRAILGKFPRDGYPQSVSGERGAEKRPVRTRETKPADVVF